MVVRRLVRAALATVLVGGMGGLATPAASETAPGNVDRSPRITVTEIVPPEGMTVEYRLGAQIDERGAVLVNVGDSSGSTSAIWRRGRFENIAPPTDNPSMGGAVDLTDRGQIAVGGTNLPPCEGLLDPWNICPRPFLWDDGETTLLPDNGMTGAAMLVADRGSVVVGTLGRYVEGLSVDELAAWIDGELVAAPEGADDDAVALNDRGQALISLLVDGNRHAAVWQVGGEVTDLGTFGRVLSVGVDINARGDVVGWSNDPTTWTGGGFLWRDGETTDLGAIEPVDINDRGQIAGNCVDHQAQRGYACMWEHGELTDLGPSDQRSRSIALNDHGQVIGVVDSGDDQHAVLWQDGQMIDLGAATGLEGDSEPIDINDRGQIAGEVGDRLVVWTVRR